LEAIRHALVNNLNELSSQARTETRSESEKEDQQIEERKLGLMNNHLSSCGACKRFLQYVYCTNQNKSPSVFGPLMTVATVAVVLVREVKMKVTDKLNLLNFEQELVGARQPTSSRHRQMQTTSRHHNHSTSMEMMLKFNVQ
jgi:hypothetical protein